MYTFHRLTLAEAQALLAAAEAEASRMGVPMVIAVSDESGNLIALHRMDGAFFTSVEIAANKAFTAAGVRMPTHQLGAIAAPGESAYGIANMHQGRFAVFGGGVPVVVNGQLVGAVGVSGGSAEEDRQVAEAATQAFLGT